MDIRPRPSPDYEDEDFLVINSNSPATRNILLLPFGSSPPSIPETLQSNGTKTAIPKESLPDDPPTEPSEENPVDSAWPTQLATHLDFAVLAGTSRDQELEILHQLSEMGFKDEGLNARLVVKHKCSFADIVDDILLRSKPATLPSTTPVPAAPVASIETPTPPTRKRQVQHPPTLSCNTLSAPTDLSESTFSPYKKEIQIQLLKRELEDHKKEFEQTGRFLQIIQVLHPETVPVVRHFLLEQHYRFEALKQERLEFEKDLLERHQQPKQASTTPTPGPTTVFPSPIHSSSLSSKPSHDLTSVSPQEQRQRRREEQKAREEQIATYDRESLRKLKELGFHDERRNGEILKQYGSFEKALEHLLSPGNSTMAASGEFVVLPAIGRPNIPPNNVSVGRTVDRNHT